MLIVVLGIVPLHAAGDTLRTIGPTVGFLAAILVFGHLCADAGVFEYLGARAAGASRGDPAPAARPGGGPRRRGHGHPDPRRDRCTADPCGADDGDRQLDVRARPHAYACTRLANSGSLLLPVSNLTNLLAFSAAGLSFGRFTALMVLPWVLVCSAEWLGLRTFFRRDLAQPASERAVDVPPAPRYALVVLAVTVALFVLASSLGIAPAYAAIIGCLALLGPRLRRRDVHPVRLVAEASPGFCVFVLALAVIVDGVTRHGLHTALGHLVPSSSSWLALLALAAVAAVLANVVNNLPATLAFVPLVAGNPAWVLAVLLGVNIGPNATYPGSLATLLWRRLLPADEKPDAAEFHRLGLLTVPLLLILASTALWAALQAVGA